MLHDAHHHEAAEPFVEQGYLSPVALHLTGQLRRLLLEFTHEARRVALVSQGVAIALQLLLSIADGLICVMKQLFLYIGLPSLNDSLCLSVCCFAAAFLQGCSCLVKLALHVCPLRLTGLQHAEQSKPAS